MTTLEVIKMLVDEAIKEDGGDCSNCEFMEVKADQYPCCKCKRTFLDYYKEPQKEEVK